MLDNRCRRSLFVLALASGLGAQSTRLPSPVDNTRVVQVHDVRTVLESLTAPSEPAPGAAELAGCLRQLVQPPLVDGDAIVLLAPGLLAVHAHPEQQAWIERVLRANTMLRDSRPQIDIESRLLAVPEPLFTRVVAPLLQGDAVNSPAEPGWTFTALPSGMVGAAQLGELLAGLRGADVGTITAPRILAWPATAVSVVSGKEVRFIRDYEVEIVDSGIAVPVARIGSLLDGTNLRCSALPLGDGQVGVSFRFELGEIIELAKFETSLAGDSRKLTLELPTWKSAVLETAVTIPAKGAALFAFPERDGKRVVLLLRAAVI